jgi:hypothetical protein
VKREQPKAPALAARGDLDPSRGEARTATKRVGGSFERDRLHLGRQAAAHADATAVALAPRELSLWPDGGPVQLGTQMKHGIIANDDADMSAVS